MLGILIALLCAMQAEPAPPTDTPPAKESQQQEQQQEEEAPPPRQGIRRKPPLIPKKAGVGKSFYTLDAPPPGFDGKAMPLLMPGQGMAGWNDINGMPTDWVLDEDGCIHASDRDAIIGKEFGDCQLHVEYSLPRTPGRIGPQGANSGVILHGRYEIELHDSYGRPPLTNCSGAIKGLLAPVANATLPTPGWQVLDVYFRAPVVQDGKVIQNPRITALLNGVLILNNAEITQPTDSAIDSDMPSTGPLILQGSPDPVIFRNLWIRQP